MSTYAHVVAGVVVEPVFTPHVNSVTGQPFSISQCFPPTMTWVDCTDTPGVVTGWLYDGTNFTAPPPPPPPTLPVQAQAAMAAGCAITSTSDTALNGTYACDATAQSKIQAISLYIVVNGTFPGGTGSYPWIDFTGAVHMFLSEAAFQSFATAIGNYVAQLDFVAAGAVFTLPAQPVAIP